MIVYPFRVPLGPVELTGYGLMMVVAFVMAGWAIQLALRRRGLNEEYAADIVFGGVIGGLIGAKLWYVALVGDFGLLFTRGGFVWYGGFFGGVAAVLAAGWLRKVPLRFTLEVCAAPLALGHAVGRVGCFMVGDDYGVPTSLPWGIAFPEGLPPSTVAELARAGVSFPPGTDPFQVVAVHPTQLYEVALLFAAFAWLWHRRDHGRGTGWLFGWYLVFAGAERFLVEVIRVKDDRLLGPFTVAQATSVALIAAGLVMVRSWRTRETPPLAPASLRPPPADGKRGG